MLDQLTMPVQLIFGSEDQLTPPSLGHDLNELLPNAQLEVLDGAGHLSNLEAPDRIQRHRANLHSATPKPRLVRRITNRCLARVRYWISLALAYRERLQAMLFVIHMIDRPDAADLRAEVVEAHREFVGGHLDAMYLGGPLVADDGTTAIGSMIVMDFSDRAAAVDFIADEPYNRAGLFESVTIRAFHPVVTPS